MANRHLSRQIVLQTLFEWDFRDKEPEDVSAIFERNKIEFSEGVADESFMEALMNGVLEKRKDIDIIIVKAAPEWPLEKISTVDRNILRIGLYELLFSDREQVPPKVAINEAIELAKSFGGNTSGKFVNGVLGAVYKEMGEPGKDEKPKKKIKNIPDDEAPIYNLGGAVVYHKFDDGFQMALVHDVFGHWTLSKGKVKEGEDVKDATIREIKEEINLDIAVEDDLGMNEYIAYHPELGKIKKRVHYYLGKADNTDIKLEESGGLNDAKWFKLEDILDLNFYDDILPLVTKAVQILMAGEEEKK
jgi:transcription antitermination protein NusB